MSIQVKKTSKQAVIGDKARDIKIIHVARQKVSMDEDTYRALLHDRFGVSSSKDMDLKQRRELLDYFKALGFKSTVRPAYSAGRTAPAKDKVAQVCKIRALLIALDNKPDAYADGMAKQMFNIYHFEWCTPQQLGKIIAALSYHLNKDKK
jgi:phage gp16-like protein